MRILRLMTLLVLFLLLTGCESDSQTALSTQDGPTDESISVPTVVSITDRIVDASCGQCQFEMEGSGCDLAIRIDGKSYFVDGTSIDDHGDAHAEDGLCNCIRKAKASGEIRNDRFFATHLEVMPQDTQNQD